MKKPIISQEFAPDEDLPCLVQINYPSGSIGFYVAENVKVATSSYQGKIVAIFKPKTK